MIWCMNMNIDMGPIQSLSEDRALILDYVHAIWSTLNWSDKYSHWERPQAFKFELDKRDEKLLRSRKNFFKKMIGKTFKL